MPRRLAKAVSSWAEARTWATEPGALSTWSAHMVWIEFDDGERRALGLERGQDVAEVGLGGEPQRRLGEAEAGGAHADLGGGLLAGDVDGGGAAARRRRRRPAGAASTCRCRGRRRRGWPRPARGRRRGRGRARRCRRGRAAAAARRRRGRPRAMRRPRAGPRERPAGPSARPASSAMVFQAPQASQRPDHLAWAAPQAVQTKAGRRVLIGACDGCETRVLHS